MDNELLLQMKGITKKFPGEVVANDSVNLSIRRNEIHGVLGENGAGKSTLMKILYGMYHMDSGEVIFDGKLRRFQSPQDAIEAGIGMVHQHFMLIPKFTVLDNIILGEKKHKLNEKGELSADRHVLFLPYLSKILTIDRASAREEVENLSTKYGIEVDLESKVWELDVGQQQRVEILKALYRDIDLLILDEPTAALTPTQVDRLFDTLRQMTADELTIIFITHKLDEARSVADRITVLRDGKVVDTVSAPSVSNSELARKMVGRDVVLEIDRGSIEVGEPVVKVENLHATDNRDVEMLQGVDLTIHQGEIVGVAGVSGNGQRELSECLVGLREATEGTINIKGKEYTNKKPKSFIDAGVSYIPEDRLEVGCATDLDVVTNSVMKDLGKFRKGIFIDKKEMREYSQEIVEDFDVRLPNVDVLVNKLSGGNIQKLILARELSRNPDVLIANQPTRGVDVGAIEFIRNLILQQRRNGTGTLLVSEELDEILQMSDRIVVIYEGEIVHETANENVDIERLSRFMTEGKGADSKRVET